MTKTYPFYQVDAFTDYALGGNACAIFFDTDDMDDARMLAIAKEMNLSESAFVRESKVADFGVRYFTPAEEIPLAGHPTIATVYALVASGRLPLTGTHTSIHLELKVGPIPIDIYADGTGKVTKIVMTQKKPAFLSQHNPSTVLPLFGLNEDDILPGCPIQTISTGTPQLFIPLRSHDALRRIVLDVSAYSKYRAQSDFFSPHLFALGGVTAEGDTFARHFGVPPDIMEDPVTGSATGGMGAYLWRYGLIEKPTFVAEQGHWQQRPGKVFVEVVGLKDDIEKVTIGGSGVLVLKGELLL